MYGYMLVRVAKSGASPGETATISLLHEFSQSLKTGWRRERDFEPIIDFIEVP